MAASFPCRHLQPGKRASISPNSTHFPSFSLTFSPEQKDSGCLILKNKNEACSTTQCYYSMNIPCVCFFQTWKLNNAYQEVCIYKWRQMIMWVLLS